jgi:hypothetical protein
VSPAVRVQVLDRFGNLETADDSDQVTLTTVNSPATFADGSLATVTVNGGSAVFDNLAFATAGTYTLRATATGGVTGPDSASFSVLLYADSFDRPDSPTLGSPWVQAAGALSVQANRVTSAATPGLAVYGSPPLTGIQVQANISLSAVGTPNAGVVARYSGPGSANYYLGDVEVSAGRFTAYLWRNRNGVWTQLASAPLSRGTGTLRLQAIGTSLKLFFNGQLVAYAYDATFTNGTTGVRAKGGGLVDDFTATALNPVSPSLPFTDSFGQPSGSQLSPAWTERAGNFSTQADGRLRANGGFNLATVNQFPAADVAVQANIALGAAASQYAGLVARYTGPGDNSLYAAQVVGSGGRFVAVIYRNVKGVWTLLSSRTITGGTGLLRFEVTGNHLKLFFNGLTVGDVTDNAITGPGLTGIRGTGGALYDNFGVSLL